LPSYVSMPSPSGTWRRLTTTVTLNACNNVTYFIQIILFLYKIRYLMLVWMLIVSILNTRLRSDA
jgi:hypothetical protein